MAKYKVGDKVIVRTDLDEDKQYWMDDKSDYWYPEEEMVALGGKTVTIKEIRVGYYLAEETSYNSYWTDTMFVGLQEETPMPKVPKFKVGDKVIGNELANKYGITCEGWVGYVNVVENEKQIRVYDDRDEGGMLVDAECFDLLVEEPKATPTTPTPVTNINITVNLYENSCWYCRKGGLVDLYLNGQLGICPSCGRVCNNTNVTMFIPTRSEVIEVEPPKRENKPLTTKELKALPNGTRVFTVWLNEVTKVPRPNDGRTCWRTINHVTNGLDRKNGFVSFNNNGRLYLTYLDMPEGYEDNDQ